MAAAFGHRRSPRWFRDAGNSGERLFLADQGVDGKNAVARPLTLQAAPAHLLFLLTVSFKVLLCGSSQLRALRSHNEIHITIEHVEQAENLVDRLPVVRLIQQAIQLGRRRA
jgi:hypothetical protein